MARMMSIEAGIFLLSPPVLGAGERPSGDTTVATRAKLW